MRKQLMTMIVCLAPMAALAANTGPGCGLGAMVFDGQSGVGPHILAATTNGTSGNQTFGLTSGTLGCDPTQPIMVAAADTYLNDNLEQVARDMATGGGEALVTLAALIGIEPADRPAFYRLTQRGFGQLFADDTVTSVEVLQALRELMAQDQILAKYVA